MKKLFFALVFVVAASVSYAGVPALFADLDTDNNIQTISVEEMDVITGTASVVFFNYGFTGSKTNMSQRYDARYWNYTSRTTENNATGTRPGTVYVHQGNDNYLRWSGTGTPTHLLCMDMPRKHTTEQS